MLSITRMREFGRIFAFLTCEIRDKHITLWRENRGVHDHLMNKILGCNRCCGDMDVVSVAFIKTLWSLMTFKEPLKKAVYPKEQSIIFLCLG